MIRSPIVGVHGAGVRKTGRQGFMPIEVRLKERAFRGLQLIKRPLHVGPHSAATHNKHGRLQNFQRGAEVGAAVAPHGRRGFAPFAALVRMGRAEQIVDQRKAVQQMDPAAVGQLNKLPIIIAAQPAAKEQPQRTGNALHVLGAGAKTSLGHKALFSGRTRNGVAPLRHRRMCDTRTRFLPHHNDAQWPPPHAQIVMGARRIELTFGIAPVRIGV